MSHVMYPQVFDDYMTKISMYSKEINRLDTKTFCGGIEKGEELLVKMEKGKNLHINLLSVSLPNHDGLVDCVFEMNGVKRTVQVVDKDAEMGEGVVKAKADEKVLGSVGASMPGVVVEIKKEAGDVVVEGDVICILSAMKMETAVTCPLGGVIKNIQIGEGDTLGIGDLIAEIE